MPNTNTSDQTLALAALLQAASPDALETIERALDTAMEDPADPNRVDLSHLWAPQPGPQTDAYYSQADDLFYGGAAGGGKSDLLLGLALTKHQRSVLYRKEITQCQDFVDRLTSDVLKTDKGYRSQPPMWDLSAVTGVLGHKLSFGGISAPGDEQKYKGRPNDLIAYDETVDFTEYQIRFLSTWNRTTRPGQRCRVVMASNPPAPRSARKSAGVSGLWLIDYFAPWLDPNYRDPAGLGRPEPGELRWYVRLPGHRKDVEHPDGVPFRAPNPNLPKGNGIGEQGDMSTWLPCIPRSRTFIPAKVHDNVYLRGTNYLSTLHSLPEPLRSIMLDGDFTQALTDQPMSLFKAAWVRDAVARHNALDGLDPSQHPKQTHDMTALGLDVARGGADNTVAAPRYGAYYDDIKTIPGVQTPDGPAAAAFAVRHVRDSATVVVDGIGVGGAAYDHLNKTLGVACRAYIGSSKGTRRDRTGKFGFVNYRSQCYWRFQEALDPSTPVDVQLPDDPDLVAELLAHSYEVISGRIKVIPKERVMEILNRSPDKADAVVMAWSEPDDASSLGSGRMQSVKVPENVAHLPPRRNNTSARAPMRGPIDYGKDRTI